MLSFKKHMKSMVVDVDIKENTLMRIVQEFCFDQILIEASSLDINDDLVSVIKEKGMELFIVREHDFIVDAFFIMKKADFNEFTFYLNKCNSEVILIYVQNDSVDLIHIIEKDRSSFSHQKDMLKEGKCSLVFTWVTNENRIHVDYDSSKYDAIRITKTIK